MHHGRQKKNVGTVWRLQQSRPPCPTFVDLALLFGKCLLSVVYFFLKRAVVVERTI